MSWSEAGSRALSLLKVVELNGEWDEPWENAPAAYGGLNAVVTGFWTGRNFCEISLTVTLGEALDFVRR